MPLRSGGERKTRLAGRFTAAERIALAEAISAHTLASLREAAAIARIIVVAAAPVAPDLGWRRDEGRGLNAELTAARASIDGPALVIHGDLPLLTSDDVNALLGAADTAGVAIAPDRHGEGTNALAALAPFPFAFGEGSFQRHRDAAPPNAAIVRRQGLAFDIDTPEDFDAAVAAGWRPPL